MTTELNPMNPSGDPGRSRRAALRRRGARALLLTAAAAVAGALTPAVALAQGGEGEAAPGLFDANLGLSLWTVVIFLALLGVLWKWAWGPILGAAEDRERNIQSALDEAARKQAEAERMLEEHKAQLADARRQAREILDEGRAMGERVRKEIEEKARTEGQAIVERARQEIQREKEQAVEALRRESVDLALAAAAKLMHQRLGDEEDRRLVLDYVEEMAGRGAAGDGSGGVRA